MQIRKSHLIVLVLSILSVLLVYRSYFFFGKVPFSANLLASFYSPWKSTVFLGWEHGIPNKPLGYDALQFFMPAKKNIIDSVKSGSLPLWNPYVFAGAPLVANMQSSFFYPSTLLYLWFAPIDAWSIGVLLTPVLCIYFMYLYLQSINLRKDVSIVIGLLWAYSSFFAVWNQENSAVAQSAVWLPFILFEIEKFAATGKKYFLILAIMGMTLSLLGGHLQFAAYIFIFTTVYFFLRTKKYMHALLFIVLPLVLSAVQLVPAIEAFANSARSIENSRYLFDVYLVPITHLINIIAPDWEGNPAGYNYFGNGSYYDQVVYVGLIPFIFAVSSIAAFKKKSFVKLYSLTAVITLLFSFKSAISISFFNLNIPFFSSVIPSRIFYLTSFCLLVLAGIGIQRLLQNKIVLPKREIFWVIGIALTLLIGGWIYYFLHRGTGIMQVKPDYPLAMERNLMLPSLVFLLSLPLFYLAHHRIKFTSIFVYSLCILAIVHQYYSYSKNTYFSERQFVYPEHALISLLQKNISFDRVVGLGKAAIKPNIPSYFGLYSPEGLDPILPKKYADLAWEALSIQNGRTVNPIIEVNFRDLFKPGSILTGNEPIFSFFNMSGVKYIVNHEDDHYVLATEKFKKITTIPPFTVWAFQALPRAFLTTDYEIGTEFSGQVRNTIILEKDPILEKSDTCNTQSAEITDYRPQSVSIVTNSDCEAILYLSDVYYPGWKAKIDNEENEIFVVNYAFRGVKVPLGRHMVTMEYSPLSLKIGFYSSLSAVIFLGLWLLYPYGKKV